MKRFVDYITPIDGQKSFYKKAKVYADGNLLICKSYDTDVLSFNIVTKEFKKLWNGYSVTTMKHINAFVHNCGFEFCGKKWWDSLECDGEKYGVVENSIMGGEYKPSFRGTYEQCEDYIAKRCKNSFWYGTIVEM